MTKYEIKKFGYLQSWVSIEVFCAFEKHMGFNGGNEYRILPIIGASPNKSAPNSL